MVKEEETKKVEKDSDVDNWGEVKEKAYRAKEAKVKA